MEWLLAAVDMVLHVDRYLLDFAMHYGVWIYALLFLIVFLETGVVVTPFLPGDSLLFATGALAAAGVMDIGAILTLLTAAAIIGDNTNYFIGRAVGPRVFTEHSKWLKREHLLRTQRFYEVHGGKTVVMARFVPIIRTFAPFVAGVGHMHYPRFLAFDVGGGILWVWSFGLLGYFFGNAPIIKENFGLAIIGVIVISLLPIFVEAWRARRSSARTSA
jgi:membrane-associated protein